MRYALVEGIDHTNAMISRESIITKYTVPYNVSYYKKTPSEQPPRGFFVSPNIYVIIKNNVHMGDFWNCNFILYIILQHIIIYKYSAQINVCVLMFVDTKKHIAIHSILARLYFDFQSLH